MGGAVQRWGRLLALAAWAVACGCSLAQGLVGTRIEIKGGHRTLEEQVLGAFERLGEEVYSLAGVRSVDPVTGAATPARPMTSGEAEALAARRRMEFNRDDVADFLRSGCVGEGNDGLLVIFEDKLAELRASDARQAQLVEEVVAEENADRLTVMGRIVQTNPELRGAEGPGAVGRILAAQRRQQAEPGTRVQLPDGSWTVNQEGG